MNAPNLEIQLTQLVERLNAGDFRQVREMGRRLRKRHPDNATLWIIDGIAARRQGRDNDALQAYEKALKLDPVHPDAAFNLGNLYRDQQQWAQAVQAYRRALPVHTPQADVELAMAECLRAQGLNDEALSLLRALCARQRSDLPVLLAVEQQFQHMQAHEDTEAVLRQEIALFPQEGSLHHNLGALYIRQQRVLDALPCFERAVELGLAQPQTLSNLAGCLTLAGRLVDAMPVLERLIALEPHNLYAHSSLRFIQAKLCMWDHLDTLRESLIEPALTGRSTSAPPLPFIYLVLPVPISEAEQQTIAHRFAEHVMSQVQCDRFDFSAHPHHERLRIGYLSADFHNHATSHLMLGLFKRHDRTRFEIYAYSIGSDDGSLYRSRIRGEVDHFVDLQALSNTEAATRIHQDEIDILVDLKGYTRDSRPEILVQRPAPLQVAWLGFPGTVGAAFADYIITDRVVSPPERQPFYDETFAYMPHCYQINDNEQAIAADTPTRADCGLPESAFVFCCFCALYKIEPVIFAVWMDLLKAKPDSVLWLLEGQSVAMDNLRQAARTAGVDPARLVFAPHQDKPRHLARHAQADLFLDTYFCNAHTTASDALWAGLPVITCPRDTFATRVCASLLTHVGLPELVAASLDAYRTMALDFAASPEKLAALKHKLAGLLKTAPLFDTDGFTRDLEALLARLWREALPTHALDALPAPTPAPAVVQVTAEGDDQIVQRALLAYQNEAFEEALTLVEPLAARLAQRPDLWNFIGVLNRKLKRYEVSREAYYRALALAPGHAESEANLGNVCRDMERYDEAIEAYQAALRAQPDNTAWMTDLGATLVTQRRLDEALAVHQRAMDRAPDSPDLRWEYALAQLMAGQWREGFDGYRARWARRQPEPPNFPQPLWQGERLSDKTLLLYVEQGFGDALQFLRFLPFVFERVQNVVLEVRWPLAPVIPPRQGLRVIAGGKERLPAFDCHAGLMDLAHWLRDDLPQMPRDVPYVAAPPDRLAYWSERIGALPGLKVGLVWAGNPDVRNDSTRSPRLAPLMPLLAVPGISFVCLQQGDGRRDLETLTLPDGIHWLDPVDDIKDFGDTAAIMASLDLVITSDTGPAHLAGALGVPVWVLLSYAGDWRWGQHETDSFWYPTARLFRQPVPKDWATVMQTVVNALGGLLDTRQDSGDDTARFAEAQQAYAEKRDAEVVEMANALLPHHRGWAASWLLRGAAQRRLGLNAAAARDLHEALRRAPNYSDAYRQLLQLLQSESRWLDAQLLCSRWAQYVPDETEAWWWKARSEETNNRFAPAAESYRRVLQLAPDREEARQRRALSLNTAGTNALAAERLAEGMRFLREAVACQPDFALAHFNLGLGLLMQGAYREGFAEYEMRRQLPQIPSPPPYNLPYWQGEPVEGKGILLYPEQGFGDAIQFLRFARALSERGARLFVALQDGLNRLAASMDCVTVLQRGDPLPPLDYLCALPSLPHLLDISLEDLPGPIPYLSAPKEDAERWREKIHALPGLRVGLIWAGSPTFMNEAVRSPRLAPLMPLLSIPGISFVCLQQGGGRRELDHWTPPPGVSWFDAAAEIDDFAGTAAVMSALDLVISSDTGPAHLAGALGVPLWIMLSRGADWRWGMSGSQSAWYPSARLFRQQQVGDWSAPVKEMVEALKSRQTAPDIPLESILQTLQQGQAEAAEKLCRTRLQRQPDAICWVLLGMSLRRQNKMEAACDAYRQALQLDPGSIDAWYNLGNAETQLQHWTAAAEAYRRCLALQPGRADAWVTLCEALRRGGTPEAAIEAGLNATSLLPADAETWNALGNAYNDARRYKEAESAYRRAIGVNPDFLDGWYNLGVLQQLRGEHRDAIPTYRHVLERNPDQVPARYNLAIALQTTNQLDEAEAEYLQVMQRDALHADARFNLGSLYNYRNRQSAALECYQAGLAIRDDLTTRGEIAHIMQKRCDWSALDRLRADLVDPALKASGKPPSPFSMLVLPVPISEAEQLTIARRYAEHVMSQVECDRFDFSRHPQHRRLRIGYLSADFHNHATSHLMLGLFKRHNRKHFEVYAYSIGPDDGSNYRNRIKREADHFVELQTLSNAQAAARINQDDIDILIDLKGYTRDCRPEILAQRPAPLQIAWLGYPGTVGAPFADFIITDRVVTPPDRQPFYDETFAYMPHCYQINDSEQEIDTTIPTRADCGLPASGFVFCCFCALYKVEPVIFGVWMDLLRAKPDSVLWLLDGPDITKDNLRAAARQAGVDPNRLVFAPVESKPQHLARHALADIFLDTYFCNAHTTASDALWAGLPVITCPQETFATRVCASLLTHIGLPELITPSLEAYRDLALRYANDPNTLAALKRKLANQRLSSPLFDTDGFITDLEKLLQDLWASKRSSKV